MTGPIMNFDNILVQGYRYADVSLTAVLDQEQTLPEGKRLDPLELREFGLDGGEIHINLLDGNRAANDQGVWYASKCVVDPKAQAKGGTGPNHRIGDLLIKQMGADYQEMRLVELDLEELDNSHLIDRIVSAVLRLHAETFGPGPYSANEKQARRKLA